MGSEAGRKAVLVLTDGRDISVLTETLKRGTPLPPGEDSVFADHARRIRSSGVPLYFVALNTDRNLEFESEEHRFLTSLAGPALAEAYLAAVRTRMEMLSEFSGGRIYFPKTLRDVAALYTQIGFDLGVSYSLGFVPAKPAAAGEKRTIQVRIRGDKLGVTQSRGEYTGK
jgi:hypothetical protein